MAAIYQPRRWAFCTFVSAVAPRARLHPHHWKRACHSAPRLANSCQASNEEEDSVDLDSEYSADEYTRTHPLTAAGRFATSPRTLELPKDSLIDPILTILSDFSNKHISETSHKCFGGERLPLSTSTPAVPRHFVQQPIPLRATQYAMGEMEGNAFLAALYPGNYASITSVLVEVRKRLGSSWIADLIARPDGPCVLDAGAGGAGILAWRDVVRAEWSRLADSSSTDIPATALGQATVVTASSVLRDRASSILVNTTFLPRLPDYVHVPNNDNDKQRSYRKQYDVIIAPNTLWALKEDYMRKQAVEKLWSLLHPQGGVVILIEKGLARGFEIIAGARDLLLQRHIMSPEDDSHQSSTQDRFVKEVGMIIAPCTNHQKCPMYLTPGHNTGRGDYCHFAQRYIRPPFLQRLMVGARQNHEDVEFSYLAVQRGKDQRRSSRLVQDDTAVKKAFDGYGVAEVSDAHAHTAVNSLAWPRAILPPLKRHGHVILDLCTPAGKIERWTVPRSHGKQAYHDARKSKWGDLWALGAKTRVARNLRLGRKVSAKEGGTRGRR